MVGILKLLFLIFFIFYPSDGPSFVYYYGVHPDKDRVVFKFDKSLPSKYKIYRKNDTSVEFDIPSDFLKKEKIPKSKVVKNTSILSAVLVSTDGKILIKTRTSYFKLSYFELREENKIVIDLVKAKKGVLKKDVKKQVKKQVKTYETKVLVNNEKSPKNKLENSTVAYVNSTNNTKDFILNSKNNTSQNINTSTGEVNKRNIPYWKIKGRIQKNATIYNPNEVFFKDTIGEKKNVVPSKKKQTFNYKIRKKIYPSFRLSNQISNKKYDNKTEVKEKSPQKETSENKKLSPKVAKEEKPQESIQQESLQNATSKVDYSDKIFQIKLQINNGEIDTALEDLQVLYNDANLPIKYREEVLYYLSDLYFQIYHDKLKENYLKISNILREAINMYPKSLYLPIWLLKLCYLNIKVGNIEEAKGYFALLKKKFPKSSYVADGYYYWGEYYLSKKDYIDAMESFKTIVENYQSSKVVKDAAIKLARVLFKMQMYQKSWIVMKYLEQRWPLFYQKAPDILKLAGFIAMYNKKYDVALSYYWKYYNILPKIEDADMVLTRIGDLYLKKGEIPYAKKMYLYVATKYPDKEGGLIAKMRLAEEGIYDEPTIKDMFSVFDRPYNLRPVKIYTEIVKKHPDSPLAPLAQLKLSMWYLWRKKYQDSLDAVKKFYEMFPNSELLDKSIDVGRLALNKLIQKAIKDNMYSLILSVWNNYSFLRKDLSKINPSTVIAVAVSLWRTGYPYKALKLAKPYIEHSNLKENFLASLELALNIYIESESWEDIEKLGDKFLDDKRLNSNLRSQLKYAYCLAKINLNKGEEVVPYLKQLAIDDNISEKQRAYVFYFLAKEAYNREDLEKVYIYSQDALSIFLQYDKKNPYISQCFNMLMDVTERSGRILESIEWALKYKKYLPDNSKELPRLEYKIAELYLKAGYKNKWKNLLLTLKKRYPNTVYGELASNDLMGLNLKKEANKYIQ